MAAIPLEEVIGLLRSPRTSRIIREVAWWQCLPNIQNRIDHTPAGFHHVGALEEGGVAYSKFMSTVPRRITDPGVLAAKRSEMPSSGWMCRTS